MVIRRWDYAKLAASITIINFIEGIFADQVTAYVEGEKSKAQALADFREQVSIQLDF